MNRMPILNNYKIINIEIENSKSIIYKGYSLQEKKLVLLKTMKQSTPTPHETASSIHEFYITKEMNMDEIIRPVKIESYLNEPILVLEYFSGVTMRDFLKTQRKDILDLLSIAVKLASALINVHQHQIIHKNINPENIIFNTSNGQIKITGFNHATKLKKEKQSNSLTPYELEGHLAYISPEQTGRMNRSVDYKADLYSLGVLFYEMFTGIQPFTSKESIELVHAHLAKTPQNPISLNDRIPESLSNIIMKLLAKIPEERYKSAFATGRLKEVYGSSSAIR
ncbi:serine/threonine protein kinase [Metabacillus endolithicus]|uniref:serine/threonine protein kinase n=1 Tax=Metabacillus endolithicus TaxID=1535204 RepID=UPI001FFA6FF5|nr:serine/threonine-protein kinase [Metabacillus endolithicus]UPG62103.1 serine/threonine protein kinase [Metabacillus endolithicus]